MRKSLLWALGLIAVCVLFFVSSDGDTTIELFKWKQEMPTALALMLFTGVGIVIGALLK